MSVVKQPPRKKSSKVSLIFVVILLATVVVWAAYSLSNIAKNESTLYKYDNEAQLVEDINNGCIDIIKIRPVEGDYNKSIYDIKGEFKENSECRKVETRNAKTFKIRVIGDHILENVSSAAGTNQVKMETEAIPATTFLDIFLSLLPFILIIVIFLFMMRNAGGGNKTMEFGKSKAKLARSKTVKFKDVAGNDEEKQEMEEIIDFLKNPAKYRELGARIPKGVLLSGPPGTGKTLLAKAVAGEANVPFFSISGSDFLEMFVGVGASRVRDMFKTARQNSPCIIFIDEIDAIGRQRGAGLGGGHDEREQTLNQLLTEMDGFETSSGVIIIAATNRPDILDPALLRPGRFDRQIIINRPDVKGRADILKVHARNKKFVEGVKLEEIAKRTPGFSGADLENLLNEAALLTARDNRKGITMQDIDEAVDRVMMGPAKKSRMFTKREKDLVAHHEAGHAVIGIKLDNAEVVHKVTIIPRGQAGGYALMLPEEETYLETKQSLLDRITGLLAGRVAEELVFNEMSTGAHNDFQKATSIARSMVTEYGMSSLGPIQYEQETGSVFLGRDYQKHKNFSDAVALEIDNEVRKIIDTCYIRCKQVLTEHMELLKQIAQHLIEMETLTKEDIYEIVETGKVQWWIDKKIEDANKPVEHTVVKEETKVEETASENKEETEKNEDNKDSNEE